MPAATEITDRPPLDTPDRTEHGHRTPNGDPGGQHVPDDVIGLTMENAMVTEEAVLKALDKPRTLYSLFLAVDPSGSQEALQILLLKMRDSGHLKFDIKKGRWCRA